jgi:hypothetical protein
MYRLRSLAAESQGDATIAANLRVDMAKAHNMATLRRDVDSQATLLNCMLRDLLRNKQGKSKRDEIVCGFFFFTAGLTVTSRFFLNVLYYSGTGAQALQLDLSAASNNQLCRYLYNGRIQLCVSSTSVFFT